MTQQKILLHNLGRVSYGKSHEYLGHSISKSEIRACDSRNPFISRGSFNRREGFSKFNKIYEFKAAYDGAQADFVMTSASGHIQNYEFPIQYKKWDNISPGALFNAQE